MVSKKPKTALAEINTDEMVEIFQGLDPEIQKSITEQTMAKMSDENLQLSKDRFMVERMLSLTMVENLKKAAYRLIQNGDVRGGKSEDAINKWFLALLKMEEDLKSSAMPKVTTRINIDVDQDTVRELVIARGKGKIQAIDAEFKEVKVD